jgi:2-dehydropantoate 2-reductase
MKSQKIAAVGAGANGTGIAADLVRAGLDVTFIEQWPAHAEAMRANEVWVVMPDETLDRNRRQDRERGVGRLAFDR